MTALHPEPRLGRVAPHGVPPLPMAVGVLALPSTTDDHRNAARLDLALSAYKLGYFVVDTIEVTPGDGETSAYRWIAAVAGRTDADALICAGDVDPSRMDQIADRARLVIRTVPLVADPVHPVT